MMHAVHRVSACDTACYAHSFFPGQTLVQGADGEPHVDEAGRMQTGTPEERRKRAYRVSE
jgi:hypothetical protein